MQRMFHNFIRTMVCLLLPIAAAASFAVRSADGEESRLVLNAGTGNLALNRAAYASSSADFVNTGHMATDGQTATKWQSKAGDQPWIYVDLGADCTIGKVVLRWAGAYAKTYKIQVSTDSGPSPATGLVEHWTDVFSVTVGKGGVEEIPLSPVRSRYVKLCCGGQAMPQNVSLAEFEVYGKGGPATKPNLAPPPARDGTWNLCAGWKLRSQSFVADDAAKIASSGYDDRQWLAATVPGTVLTSYQNAGAVPDMFFGDHQLQVSDWFCRCSWWYRTEMELPESYRGQRLWLNLDGINYKADVFVNGSAAGKIAGAFIRSRFDITDKVIVGRKNAIAVLIHPMPKTKEPGQKGLDRLYFDDDFTPNAPTFVESAGWDWLPTIRDRNIGIWNRVFLSTSGDVTIVDPFVITDLPLLPDTSRADLTVKTELRNNSDRQRRGTLRGTIGAEAFEKPVVIGAHETLAVVLDKSTQPALSLHHPKLWWPNGYGDQSLYDFSLRFVLDDGRVSDRKTAKIGIRKFTYHKERPLTIFCNGQKIMLKGANWGMDEGMLRCDRQGFQARLRMEKDMNFTILRNCLGNVSKEDFFDLCDQYGLLVWEEFGINHNTTPVDLGVYFENAKDRLRARRNHACVALWCTANEDGPPEPIKSAMPGLVEQLDGTRHYLQHSTIQPPTESDGPYETYCPAFYFGLAGGYRGEVGSPVVPTVESMRRMMPQEKLWPINPIWGMHDWVDVGPFGNWCRLTEKAIAAYGAPTGIEDFCRKAQMVNMETFKAIYEAWNNKLWNDCTGVLIWMSNPCWPSLTWNTYDYYLEPTGAYFGCKKACEPIHVQWSIASGEVKVVNTTLQELPGLTVDARIYQMDGREYRKKSVSLDCPGNCVRTCFDLWEAEKGAKTAADSGLSNVYFIKLALKDRAGRLLSDNFYWQSKGATQGQSAASKVEVTAGVIRTDSSYWQTKAPAAYQDLSAMSKVEVAGTVHNVQAGDACRITVDVRNGDKGVALMTRLKLVDVTSGLLVAPVRYGDNYFSLTPGESKQITMEFNAKNVSGDHVLVLVEGWNAIPAELARVRIAKPFGR